MKALVLAAGYARRLYPLTKDYPKPLLAVGQKSIIDYIVEKIDALEEINEILVITNSKFIPHFKKWKRHLKINKPVCLIDDLTKSLTDRRGAIGDLKFAIDTKVIKDDLLVIGGDNLFNSGLKEFLAYSLRKKGSPVIGIYNLKEKKAASKYGILKIDHHQRVIDFQEKPKKPKSTLVAMCLYFFPKERLRLIEEYLKTKEKERDATGFYINWLSKICPVYGFVFTGRWYDIGDQKFLQEAEKSFKEKEGG